MMLLFVVTVSLLLAVAGAIPYPPLSRVQQPPLSTAQQITTPECSLCIALGCQPCNMRCSGSSIGSSNCIDCMVHYCAGCLYSCGLRRAPYAKEQMTGTTQNAEIAQYDAGVEQYGPPPQCRLCLLGNGCDPRCSYYPPFYCGDCPPCISICLSQGPPRVATAAGISIPCYFCVPNKCGCSVLSRECRENCEPCSDECQRFSTKEQMNSKTGTTQNGDDADVEQEPPPQCRPCLQEYRCDLTCSLYPPYFCGDCPPCIHLCMVG